MQLYKSGISQRQSLCMLSDIQAPDQAPAAPLRAQAWRRPRSRRRWTW